MDTQQPAGQNSPPWQVAPAQGWADVHLVRLELCPGTRRRLGNDPGRQSVHDQAGVLLVAGCCWFSLEMQAYLEPWGTVGLGSWLPHPIVSQPQAHGSKD